MTSFVTSDVPIRISRDGREDLVANLEVLNIAAYFNDFADCFMSEKTGIVVHTLKRMMNDLGKTGYDCISCLTGVLMSFFIFGLWHFEGVKWGTIRCVLINGWIISRFSAFYEKHWMFYDRFPWRKYFSE